MGESQLEGVIKKALGKTVVAYGVLHKNEAGDTIRLTLRSIEELNRESLRKQLEEISQMPLPDFATTKNTEEYLNVTTELRII